ncbi:MAG: hypothetical protein HZA31_09550 [Opitutae bacterium]|nr:hypothetical protein [Opitutae bacterium]
MKTHSSPATATSHSRRPSATARRVSSGLLLALGALTVFATVALARPPSLRATVSALSPARSLAASAAAQPPQWTGNNPLTVDAAFTGIRGH